MVALMLGLAALPVNAQRDLNYYTQVVRLADGSEVRLLPDDVEKVNVIRSNNWSQMTIAEYLRYNTSLGADIISAYVQAGWQSNLLNSESAISLFCIPTDKAWSEAKLKLEPYYKYAEKTSYQTWTATGSTAVETLQVHDADSIMTSAVLSTLTKGVLSPTVSMPVVSRQWVLNGEVSVVDSIPLAELVGMDLSADLWSLKVRTGSIHPMYANGTDFMWAEPSSSYSKPEVDVLLPQTLSTTYDIYCVLVPENPAYDETVKEAKPNRVIFTLYYSDTDGSLKEQEFLDESEENITAFQEQFNLSESTQANRTTIRAFSNDPTKVDTLYVGRFTMPVCYEGLPSEVVPVLKISTPFSVLNRNFLEAFTRDIRLAAVIFRPVESENKQ